MPSVLSDPNNDNKWRTSPTMTPQSRNKEKLTAPPREIVFKSFFFFFICERLRPLKKNNKIKKNKTMRFTQQKVISRCNLLGVQ